MRSSKPKVLHEILGKTLLNWVIDSARLAGMDEIGVVVGHSSEIVRPFIPDDVKVYVQEKQLGTADAVRSASEFIGGRIVILYGDAPLVRPQTVSRLMDSDADMNVLTAEAEDPGGYGRIVRRNGAISRIVEDADANPEELKIREINSGMYSFRAEALAEALEKIENDNAKGEFYLTDAVDILLKSGKRVETTKVEDPREILGVNTQKELAAIGRMARERILGELMDSGVIVEDPSATYVGPDSRIEPGAVLKPFTFVYGKCSIESGAVIGPSTTLTGTSVGRNGSVIRSECEDAKIGEGCSVGPFSRLRPGAVLERTVKIGNYVEVKNSHLYEGVKAQHLTYLGDAEIGGNTNVGAGTITCNYDGKKKSRTTVGKDVFIGSNSALVAPVSIGDGALVGAGSVITEDVPAYALALGRARQTVKAEWVLKKIKTDAD